MRDRSAPVNAQALSAAFAQWFREPQRVNSCDHEILDDLDMFVADSGQDAGFGRRKLTPAGLERLSCLPDKTAYLRGQGREILANPLYAGLGDPLNQAHFMQILHDAQTVRVHGVPFSNVALAAKIFPDGEFTAEDKGVRR